MTMKGKKQILVAGDSGILGNHIVSQMIAQGLHVKVSGKDWDDAPDFLQGEEGRKSPHGQQLGMGGKQTAAHDETAYLPHTDSRLHDTSTGNYISADKEDTSGENFLKDNSAIASSGGRGNAYKTAKYDPHAEDVEMGGEFRHKEWEKDEPSDATKKPTGKSGAGQARYATETGSYVGEFMSMYSPRSMSTGKPRATRPSRKARTTT
jgi:hypothetical protein